MILKPCLTTKTIVSDNAFTQLYEQYRRRFEVVARSYVRDGVVAEDIVSDCFVSFWENREKIDIGYSIPAYILSSVKNSCLNWLRDRSNRLRIQQNLHSTALRIMAQRIATLEADAPDGMLTGEISLIIEDEIARMPCKMREVFYASRFEDLDYRAISRKYGLSAHQINFEIRKATKILRSALRDYLAVLFFF